MNTLFDNLPARATDPDTSHTAAVDITQDGTRARMMKVALDAVRRYPGLTSNELEEKTGLGDGKIRKRLNDLRRAGLVQMGPKRVSAVSGKMNHVWLPVE